MISNQMFEIRMKTVCVDSGATTEDQYFSTEPAAAAPVVVGRPKEEFKKGQKFKVGGLKD